jgi:hypothetical protein
VGKLEWLNEEGSQCQQPTCMSRSERCTHPPRVHCRQILARNPPNTPNPCTPTGVSAFPPTHLPVQVVVAGQELHAVGKAQPHHLGRRGRCAHLG